MRKPIEKTIIQCKRCEDCSYHFLESYKSSEKASALLIFCRKLSSDRYHNRRTEYVTKTDCPRCKAKAQIPPVQ